MSAPQQINESVAHGKERGGGIDTAGIAHEHLSTVAHIRAGAIADHYNIFKTLTHGGSHPAAPWLVWTSSNPVLVP